jgi:multidrug efflux pump subunit AcrA (membrane-fusion protein)
MPEVATAAAAHAAAETRLEAYGARRRQLEALRAEGLAKLDERAEVELRLAETEAERLRAKAVLRSAGVSPAEAARVAASGGVVSLESPVAGVVVEVAAALGAAREAGGPPLARIAGEAPLRVEARLSHALPDEAQLEFVPLGGAPVPVTLAALAPAVDARDGHRLAWFDPAGPAPAVPQGAPGLLRVRLRGGEGLVLLPARAVGRREGRAFVRKRTGGGAEEVEVSLLMLSGGDALVRGPLAATDFVAAEVEAK